MTARRSGLAVAALALALLAGVPMVALAITVARAGPGAVAGTLGAPGVRVAVWHTVVVAVAVTALAVPAGAAAALAVARLTGRRRAASHLLVALPLVLPEFVLGFAVTQAYGPTGLADQLAGLRVPGLYGPAGIVLVLAMHGVPLAYLAVTAGLAARADPRLEQAARVAGAGPYTTLRTITLPLLRTPLLAAAALVFVSAVNSFAVPELLGTPAGYPVMSTLVYRSLALSADPAAFTDLTVVALAMAALVLLALAPLDLWLGRPGATARAGAPAAPGPTGRGGRLVTAVLVGYTSLVIGLPLLAVALAAVTRAPGLAPVPAHWTLANFGAALHGGAAAALARSTVLALLAALLVPALGGLVAGAARGRARGPLSTGVALAFAIPGSALAVGVMIGYGRLLPGSAALILLAYLAKFWALGHRPVQAALDRLAPDLTAAARVSGARSGTAVATVLLPPLSTALAAAGALVFLAAFHELTMSSILYGPGAQTFAVVVLNERELGGVGTTAALAVTLTVPVLLAAGLAVRLARTAAATAGGRSGVAAAGPAGRTAAAR